jgi:uncharacterized membrane protein
MTAAVTSISRHYAAPRWMVVALMASLAVNVIIVSAAVTTVWRHRLHVEAVGSPHLAPNLLNYASTLPAVRRDELWTRTEEERRLVRPLRRELREAREASLKVMVAEPFDEQQYQAAQARLLVADQKAREAVFKLYREIAAGMSSEERQGFLRWREKRRPMQNLLDEPDKQANGQPQQ